MRDEPEVTFLGECQPLPERGTRKGQCKYPFHLLAAPGQGLDVKGRAEPTVRQAVKRWVLARVEAGEARRIFTVRNLGSGVIRVRREA